MRIFYNKDGNVVGFIDGATDEVEAGFSVPDTDSITVPQDVAEKVTDPFDDFTVQDITLDQQS